MGELHSSDLREALPALPWLSPGTDEYNKRRHTYCASNPAVPKAILCPRNAEEVASIVRLARDNNVSMSVRSGGHDLRGRSVVHDTFCIDMRDIDHVRVAKDRGTAVIGGGVRFGKLLSNLHDQGLVTPHGSVPAIGYVGWATLGGYGCNSTSYGLGVDQIVEAEVVNHKGEVVNADQQMLKGIRGAGGNFGIITSLRIKVYEMKKLLAGLLIFDSSQGISESFKNVISGVQEFEFNGSLPAELVLQPMVLNHPEAGRSMCMSYVWSSDDHVKGRQILDELVNHLPTAVVMNTVTEMSPPDWITMLDKVIAPSAWGGSQAITFGKLSPRVLDIMGEHMQVMPNDPCTCVCLHMLSAKCPSINNSTLAEASVFNPEARQPHTMVEIIGQASSEEAMERCGRWAMSMREALVVSGEATKGTYISLVGPGTMSLKDIYGEKFALLKELKQRYDPDGMFRYAVPRMLD